MHHPEKGEKESAPTFPGGSGSSGFKGFLVTDPVSKPRLSGDEVTRP